MTSEDIATKVRDMIAERADKESDIQPASKLGDLGLDSLDVVELEMDMELEFDGLAIGDEDFSFDTTVQDVLDAVSKHFGPQAAA